MPKLAIIKTQPSSSSVAAFIDSIADEQKRKDSLRRCWCFSPTTELQVSSDGERETPNYQYQFHKRKRKLLIIISLYLSGWSSFFHSRLVAVKNWGYSVMNRGIQKIKVKNVLLISQSSSLVRLVKNTNLGVKINSVMRYLFNFIVGTLLISQNLFGQVLDVAPTGRQNILPVEGGGITMKIDSTTPLYKLIERLNGNWHFLETGKGYWIGYTEDMFSIAARGNVSIQALTDFFMTTQNRKGKIGAIYTLHLIGIDRQIVGRFYEKFINPAARAALLKLLSQPEFTYPIMELLMRDPWKSDIPYFFEILQSGSNEETCWPIINSLARYKIDLPITSNLADSLQNLSIRLKVENENILEPDFDFNGQIKEALKKFRSQYPEKINVDENLFGDDLSKYYKTKLSSNLSISNFLSSLGIERNNPFSYSDIGCKIQYFVDNGKLNFCTISTARQRLINWWNNLPVEEKDKFK
ncbi:MAG: hypothetical protein J0L56_14315 [Chitinophagales bacterium]|nr:hypothetical protein [Chitinophagales bacterium]